MNNPTFTLTVMAGFDGGRIVYETVHSDEYSTIDQRLVFGGNPDEVSQYVAGRIAKMDDAKAVSPRQIEAPVKIRVRTRKQEPVVEALDTLEMLEEVVE